MYFVDVIIAMMGVINTTGERIDFFKVATFEKLPIFGVDIV